MLTLDAAAYLVPREPVSACTNVSRGISAPSPLQHTREVVEEMFGEHVLVPW